jgi:succinate dehydrogenase / fumarate reductase iron-sulfur subunit
LSYRKNCRNTICGSCAIKINGISALACKENVGNYVDHNNSKIQEITLSPLGNLPPIKDLVVDMQDFWKHLETINPYIKTTKQPEREFLQSPEERTQLNQTSNCISCGACYSECNAKMVNSEFVGPHALAKAQRLLTDSRDMATSERLKQFNKGIEGVWGCTHCYQCNLVCPMDVQPMDQIVNIKQKVLANPDLEETRAVSHHRILLDLVKADGWIDERKFGLLVVGNRFKDIRGLASLFPLGIRMLLRGKFPLSFYPSQGREEVSSLIESVKAKTTQN